MSEYRAEDLKILTFPAAVLSRPKMYTMGGTFEETIAYIDGHYLGMSKVSPVGRDIADREWYSFFRWVCEQKNEPQSVHLWESLRSQAGNDEQTLAEVARLYENFIRVSDAASHPQVAEGLHVADAKEYTDADRSMATLIWAVISRPKMYVGDDDTFGRQYAFLYGAFEWATWPYMGWHRERVRVWDDFVVWLRGRMKQSSANHPVYALGSGVSSDEACETLKQNFGEWLDEVGLKVEFRES